MTDIRRTILWVIFGFSMVMLWDQWQVYNGKPATFFPSAKPAATATAQGPAGAASGPAPISGGAGSGPALTPPTATPGARPPPRPRAGAPPPRLPARSGVAGGRAATSATATPGAVPPAGAVAAAPRERIVASSDVLRITFDTEVATVVKTEFPRIRGDHGDPTFTLMDQSAERIYLAQSGLVGGDFPTHKTVMTAVPGDRTMKDGANELVVKFESPVQGGVKLIKTYTLKRGVYDVAVKHEVVNVGSTTVSPQVYLQLVRDGNKTANESS